MHPPLLERCRPEPDAHDQRPLLSVVVAWAADAPSPAASLRALRQSCEGVGAEFLLAHADQPAAARLAGTEGPLRLVPAAADALVPELWALGALDALGDVVAFTIPECIVGPGWTHSLLDAIRGGATGAGGGFTPSPEADAVTRAVFFLRYSAFLPPAAVGPRHEIAGDNAAYDAAALRRQREALARGFWEVEVHRHIRAEGGTLVMVPEATAAFQGPVSLPTMWRQRLRHGRHFGAWRVQTLGVPWWRVVAAAPVVPGVLVVRIFRRLARRPAMLAQAGPVMPLVLALAAAWAWGEAAGAWRARSLPRNVT